MDLPKDLNEFIRSLNSNGVEYVIVGGYAQAFHGRPRFTGDIDILIRPSAENRRALARPPGPDRHRRLKLTSPRFLVP